MKYVSCLVALSFALPAWAQEKASQPIAQKFNLVEMNGQICKVVPDQDLSKVSCIERYEGLPKKIEIVEKAALANALEDSGKKLSPLENKEDLQTLFDISGAMFLKREVRDRAVNEFSRLSLRNYAVDLKAVEAKDKNTELDLPFYASLYWKGNWGLNATLLIDGVLHIKIDKELLEQEGLVDFQEYGAQIREFSDDTTSLKIRWLRWLETSARAIHFSVEGWNQQEGTWDALKTAWKVDSDAEAQKLLNEIVAPMIVAETIEFPTLLNDLRTLATVGAILNEIMQGIDQELQEDIEQVLPKERNTEPTLPKGIFRL